MTQPSVPVPPQSSVPHCYRHPDRETYIQCQRCERYICPDCMHQASVGFHCPECVAAGAATTPRVRTSYGGAAIAGGRSDLVTKIIIGLNVAVFLLIQLTGGQSSPLLDRTEMIGRVGFIQNLGQIGGVADGQYWRLLTSAFVHVQLLHILLNMIAIWIFGPTLETLLGRTRFIALYLVSALAGSVAVYLFTPPLVPTIGASGAVFGLLGAALVISFQRKMDTSWLVMLLGFNLVYSFVASGVSWQGHLGGLVAGLGLGAVLAYSPRDRRNLFQWAGFALVLAICLVLVVIRTVDLTQ
jgi:membrane associated rhomboid family serine protease